MRSVFLLPLPAAHTGARRFHLAGAFSLCAYLALAWTNRSGEVGIWHLWGAAAAGWAALAVAVRAAGSVTPRAALFWATAFTVAGLLGGPVLEDDYHRYLWDGYRFAQDGTPYGKPPAASFGDPAVPEALGAHLDQIGYPDLPTIYGPLTELVFLGAYLVAPAQLWPLQLALAVASLAVMVLLRRAGASPAAVLLAGWNPLIVLAGAFGAHPDILAAGLALAAFLAKRNGRPILTGVLLACAGASRLPLVLLAPLLLATAGARGWLAWAATLGLAYAPFLLGAGTEASVLTVFSQSWQYNAGMFMLVAAALNDEAARVLVLAAVCVVLIAAMRRLRAAPMDTVAALGVAVLAALLLPGPVVNPWYWIWLLPLAALSPWRTAPWLASAALLLAYGTRFNLGVAALEDFRQPTWLLMLEHGAIWTAVAWEAYGWRRRGPLAVAGAS